MRILFLQIALKDIFATKNSRLGYDLPTSKKQQSDLARILFSQNFVDLRK